MTLISEPRLAPLSSGLGLPFPMYSYIAAWKVYRAQSDEDDRIAAEISSLINRAVDRPASIVDIGPGDGRVILKTLIQLNHRPSRVRLIEPDASFAREARARLGFYRFADDLSVCEATLGDSLEELMPPPDVILCTHSVYFLSEAEFEGLLSLVRAGSRLVIVVDHQTSLFSELWKLTAPDYLSVVQHFLARLRSLSASDLSVKETFIEANLKDPFYLRTEMRNLVLSLLCYSDYEEALEIEAILPIIKRRSQGGQLKCLSSCFEIAPPGELRL